MKKVRKLASTLAAICLALPMLAMTGCGGGTSNEPAAAGTAPGEPALALAAPGDSQVTLSWEAPATGTPTSYNVYYGTTPGVTTANGIKYACADATPSAVITGLINDTQYYFVVTAVNAEGESAASAEMSATPLAPPGKPKGISATAGSGKVTVTWTAPLTGTPTSYNVYYGTAAGVTAENGIKVPVADAATSMDITGLSNGTQYFFMVVGVNAAGEGVPSSEASATPAEALQPPESPNGVVAVGGHGLVTITWNTKLTATSYNIYYAESATVTSAELMASGTKVSVAAMTADPQPATQSVDITALTAGATYSFVVTAENAAGESVAQTKPKPAVPSADQ